MVATMRQRDYIEKEQQKAKRISEEIARTSQPKKCRELEHQLRLIIENIDQQLFTEQP